MKSTNTTLSIRLARYLRAKRGEMTLVQYAKKLGISKSSLNRMEMGQQNVTLETLDLLCERLKCSVEVLFDESVENRSGD